MTIHDTERGRLWKLPWPECPIEGCRGIRLDSRGRCFAHTGQEERIAVLEGLREGGRLAAVVGVPFTEELLAELLAYAPTLEGRRVLKDADFGRASLQGTTSFQNVTFQGNARFHEARFEGYTWFDQASFQGSAGFSGATFNGNVRFEQAHFQGNAWFDRVSFLGEGVSFGEASFEGDAGFADASFRNGANFNRASFRGTSWFDQAHFQHKTGFVSSHFGGEARFGNASFQGDAEFIGARFEDTAQFKKICIQRKADFGGASFQRDARFGLARVQGDANFGLATFQGNASFSNTCFRANLGFDRVSFARPVEFAPMVVRGTLTLDHVTFAEPVSLEVTCGRLSCRRSRFKAGGHLRVAYAEIDLQDAEVAVPLIIGHHASPGAPPLPRPIVMSLERADVAKLTLTDLDLHTCRFTDAHHLDQLVLNTTNAFHRAPAWIGRGRQVLAEECAWRRQRPGLGGRPGWRAGRWPAIDPSPRLDPSLGSAQPLQTSQPDLAALAKVYRQLRKGQEDAKNEPGAGDFYYGESDLRRHDPSTPWAERVILTLYWLASGYGLRAMRALSGLVLVLVTATLLLAAVGLKGPAASTGGRLSGTITGKPPRQQVTLAPTTTTIPRQPSYQEKLGTAALVAAEAAVFRTAEQQLTYRGRLIQAVLRFLGPLLLGLALLAIRNRVKR